MRRGAQTTVQPQDRVGCHNGGDVFEELVAEMLALRGEAAALVVGEAQPILAEVLPENADLLDEVVVGVGLLPVDPACEDREQELEMEEVGRRSTTIGWASSRRKTRCSSAIEFRAPRPTFAWLRIGQVVKRRQQLRSLPQACSVADSRHATSCCEPDSPVADSRRWARPGSPFEPVGGQAGRPCVTASSVNWSSSTVDESRTKPRPRESPPRILGS